MSTRMLMDSAFRLSLTIVARRSPKMLIVVPGAGPGGASERTAGTPGRASSNERRPSPGLVVEPLDDSTNITLEGRI
jgi:hypothetical protein